MQHFARILIALVLIAAAYGMYYFRDTITASFQQDGTIEQVIVNILSYGVPALLGLIGLTVLLSGKSR